MGIKRGMNPRVAEVGKVKLGRHRTDKKSKSGTLLPEKLDHFIVTTTEKDKAKTNFMLDDKVMSAIGENASEIQVIFPYDSIDKVFQTSFALYQGRSCMCRGDGVEAEMIFTKDGKPAAFTLLDTESEGDTVRKGEKRKIVCDPENCPMRKPDAQGATKCKVNGRLRMIIPASEKMNGHYILRTTSMYSVSFTTQALRDMKLQTGGTMNYETGEIEGGMLAGIPAKLHTFKTYTEKHGNVQVFSVDWDFSDKVKFQEAVLLENTHRTQFKIDMQKIEQLAIESGILEDRDDPAEVTAEYYPHQTEEAIERKNKIATGNITDRADAVLGKAEDAEIVADEAEEPEPTPEPEKQESPEEKGALDLF